MSCNGNIQSNKVQYQVSGLSDIWTLAPSILSYNVQSTKKALL